MTTILETFQNRHPRSAALYQEALRTFPSGVTHDIRYVTPFPIFVERAEDSRKWDVDRNEIIDYVMGHGALFLGHGHPAIVEAVSQQMPKGSHYGANHEMELRWGQLVLQCVPSAEKVRFTSSGTESIMLTMRLARAYTGRDKILKFDFHFHGWHDGVVGARFTEDYAPRSTGVPPAILSNTMSIPQNDLRLLEETLAANDVAAVILEPTGASWGTLPLADGFLAGLRQATERYQVLLVFDEVITGFRVSPGGAQQRFGILPDLTCLAKILGGGLPGGAVAGKEDILNVMEFRDDPSWNTTRRVGHAGTFNANPVSAAAGCAMLSLLADGSLQAHADAFNEQLIRGTNQVLEQRRVPGCVYGLSSYFHIVLGQDCPRPKDGVEWPELEGELPPNMSSELALALKRGMLNHGVDLMGLSGGFVSGVHRAEDIEATLAAFEAVVTEMQAEGLI